MNSPPFDFNSSPNVQWVSDEEEDDEAGYDALNDETFGDVSLENGDDWELEHEKLAKITELSRRSNHRQHDETNELSTQIASAVLNDDDVFPRPVVSRIQNPVSIPGSQFFDSIRLKDSKFVNLPLNVSYVQDIERNIREGMSTPVPNCFNNEEVNNHNVSNARRAEDIERELTHSMPTNVVPNRQPPSLIGILPGPPLPPARYLPASVGQIPLVGVRPPGQLNFVNSTHQPAAQPVLINPIYGGQSIAVPLMPRNQSMARPVLNHNGLPAVPLPPGLPPPPNGPIPAGIPGLVNQQAGLHFQHQHQPRLQDQNPRLSTRGFYSNNSRQTKFHSHLMYPPQLQNQTFSQQTNWRPNTYMNDMSNNNNDNKDKFGGGLMSDQEKNWLAQIQLMQLNNSNHYQDDYYYSVFTSRRQGNPTRNNVTIPTTSKSSREGQPTKTTYMPQQFENSLGKLQVGSVTAPRKIIDMDVVDSVDNGVDANSEASGGSSSISGFNKAVGSSGSRTKQTLLEVEHLYEIFLRAEAYLNSLSGLTPPEGEDPHQMMNSIARIMLRDVKLNSYVQPSKGKKLIVRVLPFLSGEICSQLMKSLLSKLINISRKDPDQIFLEALPFMRKFILTADLSLLNEVATQNLNYLPYILNNTFCISIFASMLERAEDIIECSCAADIEEWLDFVHKFISAEAANGVIERPVIGLDPNVLRHHVQRSLNRNRETSEYLREKMLELVKALSNLNGNTRPD